MKVALVYDRVNKFGGAERVLMALHRIWPDAPLFTSVYDPTSVPWARDFHVITSWLQRVPFAKKHHEWFAWATPVAFESFSFDGFDVVISVTSAEAKNIITKPNTMHVCYCLTPTRYLWSGEDEYHQKPAIGMPKALAQAGFGLLKNALKRWDLLAASRPDYYLAISERVKKRVEQYYRRPVAQVIYPPVDVKTFRTHKKNSGEYFLTVSRLVGYKHVDVVVEAFNTLGWPLVVIGDGWEYQKLRKMAKSNITFVRSHLTDLALARYYQKCRAFVFAGDEDFGIVAAEAQAAGRPVIAYRKSGVAEIVVEGASGVLFDEQNATSLVKALKYFETQWYDSSFCVKNAERFSEERFCEEIKESVERLYKNYL